MLQRAFKDGTDVDMSIRLIASAHLCTLDSFVHYYMSFVHYYMTFIQAGYSQGSHSIMRQQAGTYYTAACVSCKISYMYLSMTVRTERNRLKKKTYLLLNVSEEKLPRQSGP